MKNMKVLVAGALLLALSSMMIAGCGDKPAESTTPTTTPASGASSDTK